MANYSSNRTCSYCRKSGHNRRTCPDLAHTYYGRKQQVATRERTKTNRRCGFCQRRGHTARTCEAKTKMVAEATGRHMDQVAVINDLRSTIGAGDRCLVKFHYLSNPKERRYRDSQEQQVYMLGLGSYEQAHANVQAAREYGRPLGVANEYGYFSPALILKDLKQRQSPTRWANINTGTIQFVVPDFKDVSKTWELAGEYNAGTETWNGMWQGGQRRRGVTTLSHADEYIAGLQKLVVEQGDNNPDDKTKLEKIIALYKKFKRGEIENACLVVIDAGLSIMEVVSETARLPDPLESAESHSDWLNDFTRGKDNTWRDFKDLCSDFSAVRTGWSSWSEESVNFGRMAGEA